MEDKVYYSPDMPPPAPVTTHQTRDFHGPVPAPINNEETYKLLLLSKELMGHPHLASIKALVDQQLVEANAGAKDAADRMVLERKRKEADRIAKENFDRAEAARRAAVGAAPPPAVADTSIPSRAIPSNKV